MKLAFKIAIRFLKTAKWQTILIGLGIAIGVAVQIFIGLLIQGLQISLVDKTIGSSPHITIQSTNYLIEDYDEVLNTIQTNFEIKNIAATAESVAFLQSGSKNISTLVRGFDSSADKIYKVKDSLYQGVMPQETYQILIGKELQEELDITLNQTLELALPGGEKSTFTVVGFYDLKVATVNRSWIITNIATTQDYFSFGKKATAIEIQVYDVFKSDVIAKNIEEKLNNIELKIVDWQSQNESLLSGLSGQNISSIMIQVFVIISVVLGIASVLAVSVLQKSRQIGILKAMGIKDKESSLVFLFQGLILGILGAVIGIVLGVLLILAFTNFALNPDGTPLIPMTLNYGFIAMSAGIAVVASIFASLIPAIRSLKLDPIEVIRNG